VLAEPLKVFMETRGVEPQFEATAMPMPAYTTPSVQQQGSIAPQAATAKLPAKAAPAALAATATATATAAANHAANTRQMMVLGQTIQKMQ